MFCSDQTNTFYEAEDNEVTLIRCAHVWDQRNDGVSSLSRSLIAWRRFLRAKFSLETTRLRNRYAQRKGAFFLKMIPRLRKSHVFTFESENVQSEDKTRLKPDAGGLERSSPFPFKWKEGFRNLWEQLAVRFDGRHCGMRTLPPVSSKLLWRFGQFAPPCRGDPQGSRPRSEVCGYRPADRTNKAACRGFGGDFGGSGSPFWFVLQVSSVSSRSQQTLVHISWPPTACFSHLLNISAHIKDCVFFLFKIHQGSLEVSVTSGFVQDLGSEWSYRSIWTRTLVSVRAVCVCALTQYNEMMHLCPAAERFSVSGQSRPVLFLFFFFYPCICR